MKKKGYVLPLAIFTGLFILTMLLLLLNILINQIPLTEKSIQNLKSEYSAEAGIDEGIYILVNQLYNDVKEKYNVSYKSSHLIGKEVELEDNIYKIEFLPNEIKYTLSEKRNNNNNIEYYYITGIQNNQFKIISSDKNGYKITANLEIKIDNNKIQWNVKEISKDR